MPRYPWRNGNDSSWARIIRAKIGGDLRRIIWYQKGERLVSCPEGYADQHYLFVAQRTVVMSTLYTLLRLGGSKIIRKKDRFMLSKCVLSYVKKITLV